jgi:hypothetical protein
LTESAMGSCAVSRVIEGEGQLVCVERKYRGRLAS